MVKETYLQLVQENNIAQLAFEYHKIHGNVKTDFPTFIKNLNNLRSHKVAWQTEQQKSTLFFTIKRFDMNVLLEDVYKYFNNVFHITFLYAADKVTVLGVF